MYECYIRRNSELRTFERDWQRRDLKFFSTLRTFWITDLIFYAEMCHSQSFSEGVFSESGLKTSDSDKGALFNERKVNVPQWQIAWMVFKSIVCKLVIDILLTFIVALKKSQSKTTILTMATAQKTWNENKNWKRNQVKNPWFILKKEQK